MTIRRQRWQANLLAFKDEPMFAALIKYDMPADRHPDVSGNLVSSHIVGSKLHAPVLDIDVPIRVVPSTTPGHCHIYIDVHQFDTNPITHLRVKIGILLVNGLWKWLFGARVSEAGEG